MSGRTPPRACQRMKQLCVSLDPETMADIDAAAEALGQTRSEFVRERLEWALLNLKEGKA